MFGLENLPRWMWELHQIDRIRSALKHADAMEKCPDCRPEMFLFPIVDEKLGMIWTVVQGHDRSCPAYAQTGEHFEVL